MPISTYPRVWSQGQSRLIGMLILPLLTSQVKHSSYVKHVAQEYLQSINNGYM